MERALDLEKIFSVSELNQKIKSVLDNNLNKHWIRGEISNLKIYANGHAYFSLKDSSSQISAVLFKNYFSKETKLKDGLQIIVYGEISIYEPRGTYNIVVQHVLNECEGKLKLEFEKLKKELELAGYFDQKFKKTIPKIPQKIALITSQSGAVMHDFLQTLRNRNWKGYVAVIDSKVQGADAPKALVQALKKAQTIKNIDLIVIARGGGSLEDLWCFNDTHLIKTIFECPIPTISAIGHEVDFTFCDWVCDVRAPTPTAAAEMITAYYFEYYKRWEWMHEKIKNLKRHYFQIHKYKLERIQLLLTNQSPKKRLPYHYLKLDEYYEKIKKIKNNYFFLYHKKLLNLNNTCEKLSPAPKIEALSSYLKTLADRIEKASPKKILDRGFAIIMNMDKNPIDSLQSLKDKETLYIQMKDGICKIKVQPIEHTQPL